MKIKLLRQAAPFAAGRISLRCPGCGQLGIFEPISDLVDIVNEEMFRLGQRMCPNPACRTHVFIVASNSKGGLLRTYPPLRIDFDTNGIPAAIVKTFEDALTCYAEKLFVPAAIMIRRTLEELCEDKKAVGNNLKERIAALQSAIVIPKELFTALDDLRLLGNDAAHVEAKTYDTVGDNEIAIAIDVTKEILKAIYQYDSLVSRLKALKKSATP